MYTSAINENKKNAGKTTLIYLTASIICAVFGAVYEIFSHGVYSIYMIYAFAFPLLCGTLPFLLLTLTGSRRWQQEFYPGILARSLYHCGIIALTTGSLLTGVLEIYGTTNYLVGAYWLAGAVLLFSAVITWLFTRLLRSSSPRAED